MNITPGNWTIETVPTQVGHCHKIMPVGACLYVDQQFLPRDADNRASIVALANARAIALVPEMIKHLEHLCGACERFAPDIKTDEARAILERIKG
jgi:hypothetical protein